MALWIEHYRMLERHGMPPVTIEYIVTEVMRKAMPDPGDRADVREQLRSFYRAKFGIDGTPETIRWLQNEHAEHSRERPSVPTIKDRDFVPF